MGKYDFLSENVIRSYSIKLITDGYTGIDLQPDNIIIDGNRIISDSVLLTESLSNEGVKLGLSDKSVFEFTTISNNAFLVKDTEFQVLAVLIDKKTNQQIYSLDMGKFIIDEISDDHGFKNITAYSNKLSIDGLNENEQSKFAQEIAYTAKNNTETELIIPANYLDIESCGTRVSKINASGTSKYSVYEDDYYTISATIGSALVEIYYKKLEYDQELVARDEILVTVPLSRNRTDKKTFRNRILNLTGGQYHYILKFVDHLFVSYEPVDDISSYGFLQYGDYYFITTFSHEPLVGFPYLAKIKYSDDLIYTYHLNDNFDTTRYYGCSKRIEMKFKIKNGQVESHNLSEYQLINDYYELLGFNWAERMGVRCYYSEPTTITDFPNDELFPSNKLYPSDGKEIEKINVGLGMQEEQNLGESPTHIYEVIKYCYFAENDSGEYEKIEELEPIYDSSYDSNKIYDISDNSVLLNSYLSKEDTMAYVNIIRAALKNINKYYVNVTATLQGTPFIRPGDYVELYTESGMITTYITNVEHKGEQGMTTYISNNN